MFSDFNHLLDQFEGDSACVGHLAALLQHRGEADQLTPVAAAGLLLPEGDGAAVRVGAAPGHAVKHPHLLWEPAQHSAVQYLDMWINKRFEMFRKFQNVGSRLPPLLLTSE